MYKSKRRIAFKLCINDYSQSVKIVYLIKALIMVIHLVIDAVRRFDTALKRVGNMIFLKLFLYLCGNALYKIRALAVFILNIALHLGVSDRVKVGYTQIFKLLLDLLHTESVCERRVHVHGLKRCGTSLGIGLYRKRTHIVKSVTKLDKYNSYVLGHRKKHFTKIFDMRLFLVLDIKRYELCKSVYEHCDLCAKHLLYLREVCLVGAILHGIVKQSRAY